MFVDQSKILQKKNSKDILNKLQIKFNNREQFKKQMTIKYKD